MLISIVINCILALACWWMLTLTAKQLRSELRKEIEKLSSTLHSLEQKQPSSMGNGHSMDTPDLQILRPRPLEKLVAMSQAGEPSDDISPETQEAIQATLSALLCRNIRIRSIKVLQEPDRAMSWVTQGRIAVQLSHNQRVARG